MDYLRSCYSTTMTMTVDGQVFPVDWYFVPKTRPIYPHPHPGSLNWWPETPPAGGIGEVARGGPWRDGSVPPQVNLNNATNTTLGLADWYANGAPADFPAIQPITWYGARAFPGPFDVGIFPTFSSGTPLPSLSSSIYGTANVDPLPGAFNFTWPGRADLSSVDWTTDITRPLFACFPGLATQFAFKTVIGEPQVLQCTSWDQATGVSVWQDTTGGYLDPGERLTLTAP